MQSFSVHSSYPENLHYHVTCAVERNLCFLDISASNAHTAEFKL